MTKQRLNRVGDGVDKEIHWGEKRRRREREREGGGRRGGEGGGVRGVETAPLLSDGG